MATANQTAAPATTLNQDVAQVNTWEDYLKLESVRRDPKTLSYAGRVRGMGVQFDRFKRMLSTNGNLVPIK